METGKMQCSLMLDAHTQLGEGLLWDEDRQRIMMTDIEAGRLIEIDIISKRTREWKFHQDIAWVLKTKRNGVYLLGLRSGIALFDIERSDKLDWICTSIFEDVSLRPNDACVDPHGNVWFGTMNSSFPSRADGRLIRYSPEEGLQIQEDKFTVANGPVVSEDGSTLYVSDTLNGIIYRYQLSKDGCVNGERKIFAKFEATVGYPDGMCLDAEGHLWVALWGGGRIVKLNNFGSIVGNVVVPSPNVTNVCFCGSGLDRLIVSSACKDLDHDSGCIYPFAGALFEITGHGSVGLTSACAKLEI